MTVCDSTSGSSESSESSEKQSRALGPVVRARMPAEVVPLTVCDSISKSSVKKIVKGLRASGTCTDASAGGAVDGMRQHIWKRG